MQNQENKDKDIDEIAAGLAAIYAYLATQDRSGAFSNSEPEKAGAAWQQATRFESLNLGPRILAASQIRSHPLNWRNSMARKWSSLSISMILIAYTASSASALERIQYTVAEERKDGKVRSLAIKETSDPETKQLFSSEPGFQPLFQPLCPAAPRMVPDTGAYSDKKQNKTLIRVAIASNARIADIVLPDGGEILEESSGNLLADLPPQSCLFAQIDGQNNKQIYFKSKAANSAASKILVASDLLRYQPASYKQGFKSSLNFGFLKEPQLFSREASFFLPVNLSRPPEKKEPGLYRPVSLQQKQLVQDGSNSVRVGLADQSYVIRSKNPDSLVSIAGKSYRGILILRPRLDDGSFLVINKLDLEDYLLSVVPSEMPSSWNQEALKAQSITARSYAIANLGKHAKEGYDVKASTEDQVYLGVQTESDSTNYAVAQTDGQVLKHKNKVVSAFFHSSAGGATEISEHVWGSKVPFLKSVPDFDEQSPHFSWSRQIRTSDIEASLKKQGREIGGLLGIFPLERGTSQRVSLAIIAGTLQTLVLSGEELRRILQLPSTVFNIGHGPESYLVAGRGFGHGLGMSQWGAKYLSEQGYNAAQILSYYYKDVSVERY